MTSVLALPAHHPATPLVSPLSSNFSRQLRFIGFRRRQLLRTNVAMPIAVCAEKKKEVNPFLKFAVGAVTEILRIFNRKDSSEIVSAATPSDVSVADVDDLIAVLESDYNRSYFLTGEFTTSIYAEDCCFVDPTIKFNDVQEGICINGICSCWSHFLRIHPCCFLALNRTYLKFPWRPLISLEGSTIYDLNDNLKIINHAESWSISPFEAITQIFVPSSNLFSKK
ncbi:uncharacterized protein LOC131037897 isoform X2 [Cryptomeria japonica]|uniref:uncharacterized protein LOC131037897 isoform X2 n=1 Tax=Cryptomeria japonica TaxID=3369 RepID=UPI0027DA3F12|nr:uncharacterized protein LOC131037897 isoform X2 [Cryptomeria japonica]